ncbi:MAG: hypothetical protein HY344_00810 [Candidatus Levybacteria bacterium]|nr:hypothetical protein [Candidatus Levybacteria bacterium]
MKKLIFLFVFILFIFLVSKQNLFAANRVTDARCLTITGKFTAKNWVGGPMMVGCNGDAGKVCNGQLQKVRPGQTFTLSKCSCPPFASGCLVIGKNLKLEKNNQGRPRVKVVGKKIPDKCTLTHKKNVCGVNGQAINANFNIKCNAPTSTNTPTPTITLTPTLTPSVCPFPDTVVNVKVTCPTCVDESLKIPSVTIKITNLSCTNTENTNQMRLDWNKVEGAQEYIIYSSSKKDGEFGEYATITDNFYEQELTSDSYLTYFAVKARNPDNISAMSNVVFSGPVPTLCPSPTDIISQ